MTAPFAWLFLRLPDVALISGVVLFANVLSTFWYQYQIEYHYSLVAVPALAIGTMYAIGALRDRRVGAGRVRIPSRWAAVGAVGAASIVASSLWSPMPWSDAPSYFGDRDNVYAASARELLDDVPADAVVSANYRLTPHLAYRTEIYQFPVPFRVVLYGPDASLEGSRLAERADRVEFVLLPVSRDAQLEADWAAIGAAFDEVERNDFWVLYRRDRDTPLPPP